MLLGVVSALFSFIPYFGNIIGGAIPFLAMLNIILRKIPAMQPYSYLLGNQGTSRHELTMNNIKRFVMLIKDRRRKNSAG